MKQFNILDFKLTLYILLIIQSANTQTKYDGVMDKKN